MADFGFPILSALIWIPVIAGIVILFIPATMRDMYRGVAITAAFVTLALSATVFFGYNGLVTAQLNDAVDAGLVDEDATEYDAFYAQNEEITAEIEGESSATVAFKESLVFEEYVEWVPEVGIAYNLGVDGLTAPMVLLTGMVAVAGVFISWRTQDRQREFLAFFMLLVAGVMGVFISVDLFLLFFFYELAIFPMYILIAGWGWVKLREYAAMKLTIYILVGSVISLIGAIAMVFAAQSYFLGDGATVFASAVEAGLLPQTAHELSFNITQITLAAENGAFQVPLFGTTFAQFWFPFVFLGFAVMAGVFPFHNWSPDGHVAAPTAVSMIHAGVLMKLGAFAALRVGVQLLPSGAVVHLPWIVFLTLVNVVYGAFIAFRQRDFKYVIGFSSVSHMGLVSMGFATMNLTGMTGAGLQMFSHGAMTALFFGCVGMVYDRAHTRDIPSLGGFMKQMPWVGVAFIVGGLTSMGMPGLSGFVAEFPIFQGMWEASGVVTLTIGGFTLSNYYSWIVILAALGIVITAAYVLRVTGAVFFGEFDAAKYPEVGDITITDRMVLIILGTPLLILGMYPAIMAPMISVGVYPVQQLLSLMGA
ncbi:MAG: NADH-quinone oxidoreductase subunit M [Phototrophicaceae bacterium]